MELSCPADILASSFYKGKKVTVPDKVLGVNFNDLLCILIHHSNFYNSLVPNSFYDSFVNTKEVQPSIWIFFICIAAKCLRDSILFMIESTCGYIIILDIQFSEKYIYSFEQIPLLFQ